jgi:signal transduction histidine kinase/ligand-binding sensor domain-containing protein/CheY-like chemotaxis protein
MIAKIAKSFFYFKLLINLLFCFGSNLLFSQETSIEFKNLLTESGLTNKSVVCIFQDNEGFLWFGTYGGLFRYDGRNFKLFQPVKDDTNSLINNHVRSICQDKSGMIIIGTVGGISIYSPETEKFRNFYHNPNDINSLSNNTVYKVLLDKSQTIWVGTWGGGLDKMEKLKDNTQNHLLSDYRFVHHVYEKDKNSISSNRVIDIVESSDETLWIATQNGLNRYNKKTNRFYAYFSNSLDPNSISNNNISSVCIDKNGNIWAGTFEFGLNMLNPNNNKFVQFKNDINDKNSLSFNIIMKLYCDSSGNIWVGTWGGGLDKVVFPNENSHLFTNLRPLDSYKFIHYKNEKSNPASISGNSIYSILEDRTGVIWVGTDWHGVNKFKLAKDRLKRIFSVPGEQNSLVSDIVFSILKDKSNLLWIATQNGVNTYNSKTGKFTLYQNNPSDPNSLSHNEARSIVEDKNGTIWIGTVQGLNKFDQKNKRFIRYFENPKNPGFTYILNIFEDSKGYLWLGTYQEGLMKFDPVKETFKKYVHDPNDPESISDDIIWSVSEDNNNILWVGTEKGGLCEFDPSTEKFKTYLHERKDSKSLSQNTIFSVKKDYSGNLWVGTISNLCKIVPGKQGKYDFISYNNNLVNGIVEDSSHKQLWLLTNKGLGNFNYTNSAFTYYKIRDGLQFSINAIYYDNSTGEIYSGGINGYNIFNPKGIGEKSIPPVTRIVNLRLFNKIVNINEKVNDKVILNKSITFLNKLELSYKEYVISLEYAALHYQSPIDNSYAYILEGFDKDWNYVGGQQIATYTNLHPGIYVFKVKSANPDGVWNNQPTSIEIVIEPAWWDTTLFKVLLFIIVISIAVSIFRIRIGVLKKRQDILENMVSKRTEELAYANTVLKEQQEEISLQNEELIEHRNDLEELVSERTSELKIAKDKAEESDRLKSAFLANMSHEIRTPMNAIIGFSGLLDDETIEPMEKKSFINTIRHNGDILLTLINDILDISLIEANQLSLFKVKFCVDDILEELKTYYNLENDKLLSIEYVRDDSAPKIYLINDSTRFRQIFTNLLDNAYKFTENGYINFGHTIEKDIIKFYVKDTGVGINEENKSKIFNYFSKIEPDITKIHKGTGIGLSISKKLVNLMGGEITVESVVNEGSTFYFTLPHNFRVKKIDLENKADGINDLNFKNITIVIAEDEPDNFLLIEKILTKTEAGIVWAHNGKEAVDYISKHCLYDKCIVLMDIKMPVMDGNEACKKLKEINNQIPIIAVTAYAQAQERDLILRSNFDDYISKPIKRERLLDLIYYYVNKL